MPQKRVDQPTGRPTRKQAYVGVTGVLTAGITVLVQTLTNMDIHPDIAVTIPLIAGWIAGYIVREDAEVEE